MRTAISALLLFLGSCATPSPPRSPTAEDVSVSKVAFASGDETVQGMLVTAGSAGAKRPGVVMIHEWWGYNDQIEGLAKRLAREGYHVLCVDLYRGRTATSSDEAHELMRALPEDRAERDLLAAFAYLRDRADSTGKVGSVGFCMGGSQSLSLAVAESDLDACVIFYGRLLTSRERLGRIGAAVQGHFGSTDRGIPVGDVRAFEAALAELGKSVEIHVYDGAGHAFMNENRPSHLPSAAAKAWERMLAHFRKHLGGP